jgi:hypothetical protein
MIVGVMAMLRPDGHDVAYLAWAGALLFFAGIAAFRGSLMAAAVISGLSAFMAIALLWILVRASNVRTAAITANVMIVVLLLLPLVVTALEWRAGARRSQDGDARENG